MLVLVPAAGQGERFSKVGYSEIKPLIPVPNSASRIIEHVLAPLPKSFVPILGVRMDHLPRWRYAALPHPYVVCPRADLGQAGSVLDLAIASGTSMALRNPVFVLNSDVRHDIDYGMFMDCIGDAEAAVATFTSDEPCYSYVDKAGEFDCVIEKEVVSDQAISGLYFFRNLQILRAALFNVMVYSGRERAQDGILCPVKEIYLSAIFKHIAGRKISITLPQDEIHDLGTPEKLEVYARTQHANYKSA